MFFKSSVHNNPLARHGTVRPISNLLALYYELAYGSISIGGFNYTPFTQTGAIPGENIWRRLNLDKVTGKPSQLGTTQKTHSRQLSLPDKT